MCGLAEILHISGYAVSGSDSRESAVTRRLEELGVRVSIGHATENVIDADVVVYSSAVSPTNPELTNAAELGIPVIPRAEMLAELMRMKYGIAIAGSHGKTTTTSLVGAVLEAAGLDPTTIVGGMVKSLGANSQLGAGDILVAEADESDGSFLRLVPTVVVITNVDREHLEHYGSFDALERSFLDFANRVPFYGVSVLCLDDPGVQRLLPEITRRTTTYGLSAQADVSADQVAPDGLATRFRPRVEGRALDLVRLSMPGEHNVKNALAAIAVGLEFGVSFAHIRSALEGFRGVRRRFEVLGERAGALVIDDYAHHPAEILATLAAARQALDRRIVVVFQPHRYTRTRDTFDDLARAFHDADQLLLTDIYPAGEEKLAGVSASLLAEAARDFGHHGVRYVAEKEEIARSLQDVIEPGDAVIFMGAGDIGRIAQEFAAGREGPTD
jgi:UDP-N-acetylmuramate--alanine ligase